MKAPEDTGFHLSSSVLKEGDVAPSEIARLLVLDITAYIVSLTTVN